MTHATIARLAAIPLALIFATIAHAESCLIQPIKEAATVRVDSKNFTLKPESNNPLPSLDLRRCTNVSIVSGLASITFKDDKRGWRHLKLAAGESLTEAAMRKAAALSVAGGGLAQLGALLRGDSGSQFGLSRGEPAVAGMPFGKVLRPAQTWELAIAHPRPQTLVFTPPLTSRRQPLTLAITANEAARIPADFLVPGGIYRWRLERDGKAHEGRFQILDAESQSALEKSLAAISAESAAHRALLRSLQLDAAGLEYDRDRTLAQLVQP
jgi:hypothetical protein